MEKRLALTTAIVAVLAALFGAVPSWAQAGAAGEAAASVDGGLEKQVRELALSGTQKAVPGVRRFEVSVGQLDPRLRLAPCQQVQPYVPDGMRLWGKGRIGLRCVQGPVKWNVYLPITVKAFGPALVTTGGVAAGAVLTAADLATAEIDLAEDGSAALTRAEQAVGRTLARALGPGQALHVASLKSRQWFAAGETVTVLATGEGFSVAGEAQALNPGIEGQPVRVRTDSGRVLIGQPVGERRVELAL